MNDHAHDSYNVLSRYYDLEFDGFDADLDMYQQFAANMHGPVLELGCGSGRILRHLEALDIPLTGVDTSPSMLAAARARLNTSVELLGRDMRSLHELSNAPFALSFCAINTFLHLPDADSQLTALESVRGVTAHDGVLLLDVLVPQPDYLATLDGRIELEFSMSLPGGSRLDKWATRIHELSNQTIYTTVYYDVTAVNGSMSRAVGTYSTRYIHLFEMEHLLARTGWEIVSIYGGYDLHPFDSDSERMIFLATPGGGE